MCITKKNNTMCHFKHIIYDVDFMTFPIDNSVVTK